MKKKVIISACLLGEYCRYDAKTKKINTVIEAFKNYEIIPFCPEAPLFGTPRERISIIFRDGEERIVTHESDVDVTQSLGDEIDSFCKKHPQVDAIVLKSKSPSCGNGTTPILNEKREHISYGDGIAAKMFKNFYNNINLQDETDFL